MYFLVPPFCQFGLTFLQAAFWQTHLNSWMVTAPPIKICQNMKPLDFPELCNVCEQTLFWSRRIRHTSTISLFFKCCFLSGFIFQSSFFIKGMGVLVDQKLSIFQITLLSLHWSICNWSPNSTESTWQKLIISPDLQSPKLVIFLWVCEGLHWQTFTPTKRILFLPEYKIVDELNWINEMVWISWIDQN